MDKSLSTISQKCPTCGRSYEWMTWEEPRENLQMLRLSCRHCDTVKTFGIPREEFRENVWKRLRT